MLKKIEKALVCAVAIILIAIVLVAVVWQILKALVAFIIYAALFVLMVGATVYAIKMALSKEETTE